MTRRSIQIFSFRRLLKVFFPNPKGGRDERLVTGHIGIFYTSKFYKIFNRCVRYTDLTGLSARALEPGDVARFGYIFGALKCDRAISTLRT